MEFEKQVIATIREYNMIPPGAHILVGISGGADSVCLLALLEHLRRKNLLNMELRAVHVHHGLRAAAEEDVRFVRRLCGELGIPAAVYRVDAAAEAKRRRMSTEEAGRILRREVYLRECTLWEAQEKARRASCDDRAGKDDAEGKVSALCDGSGRDDVCVFRVALAHHLEDSAETLLFHLCRGSSTAGLTGIRPAAALDVQEKGMPERTVSGVERALDRDADARAALPAPAGGESSSGTLCRTMTQAALPAGEDCPKTRTSGETAAIYVRENDGGHNIMYQTDIRHEFSDGLGEGRDGMAVDVIRPLIRTSRMQIEEWLTKNGYTWRTDETNMDSRYTRNYLRNEILPALEANVNAGCAEHMARAAMDLAEAEAYLKKETEHRMVSCRTSAGPGGAVYSVGRLREQEPFWRRRILHEAMVQAVSESGAGNPARDIASSHVDALVRLLDAEGCARMDLPRGLMARKEYDFLTIESAANSAADPLWPGHYITRIFPYGEGMEIPTGPYTKWVDYDTITQSLSFRARRDGDVMALEEDGCGGYHYKKLARVLIDRKIPARLRERMVLPMDGSHVVWFPGYRIGAEYRITGKTRTVLEICWEVESNGRGIGSDSAGRGGEANS